MFIIRRYFVCVQFYSRFKALSQYSFINVRTLKVMFEYSDFKNQNKFKQKSFLNKLKFNSLSKVVTQQSMTIFIQLLLLPLDPPFLWFFIMKHCHKKHVHIFCPLSPLCWKKITREKGGSWFYPLHSRGWNFSEKNKELNLNIWT